MRLKFLAMVFLFATPAFSGDWWTYDNTRFGYSIELPEEFPVTIYPDNNDGLALAPADKSAKLVVFGTHMLKGDFSNQAKFRMGLARSDGWQISYSKVAGRTLSFSGTRRDRILYVRGISLCNGDAAFFQMDYPKTDMHRYDVVVMRLVRSLKPTEKCSSNRQVGERLFKTG
jgi:hypothetical protein